MTATSTFALAPDLQRITVVAPSWVGDTIMATPVFRALREHCPDARLTVLGRPGLNDVLAGSPFVDACESMMMKGIGGMFRAGRVIRDTKPDAVLLLPNSFRSALAVRLSGAPIRAGYARDGRGWLLTHGYDFEKSPEPSSTVDYYARLVELACGIKSVSRKLELAVTEEEQRDAAAILDALGNAYVILNPGGNRESKRWPVSNFARLAEHLSKEHGLTVAVSGSPGERDLLESIVAEASTEVFNLAAMGVTLRTLKAVIQSARLLVTNDTGPRHIAAALGTPIVGLFGPTDPRWTTLTDVDECILVSEPFLPSELTADDFEKACAIDRIPVSDVLFAVDRVLHEKRTPANEGA